MASGSPFRFILPALAAVFLLAACEEPAAQGPDAWNYQNGYPQTTQSMGSRWSYEHGYPERIRGPGVATPGVSYTPVGTPTAPPLAPTAVPAMTSDPQQPQQQAAPPTGPVEIQTTPVPLGVQTLPAPAAPTAAATATMAVPGRGAYDCSNDTACGLTRCNVSYGKCAYPCQSELDCQKGNVCSKGGACLPRSVAGLSM
jgi:hypothetical protein